MTNKTPTGLQKTPAPMPRADFHPLAFLERQRKFLNISRVEMVRAMGGRHTDNTVWRIERFPERAKLSELSHYVQTLEKLSDRSKS